MHLYWRVFEELKYLNETWTLTDPSLSRCFSHWVRKNADALTLADRAGETGKAGVFSYRGLPISLN
ncbi:MAG: hypothetical protein PVG49_07375 [Desulfobacteraceae bacterium]|jgi:hypothetical protein